MHGNLLKTAKEEIKNFPVFFSSLKPIFYFEPSNDLSFLNPIRSLFEKSSCCCLSANNKFKA
jgi:hypothetical protein